jgi:hypothetical protein
MYEGASLIQIHLKPNFELSILHRWQDHASILYGLSICHLTRNCHLENTRKNSSFTHSNVSNSHDSTPPDYLLVGLCSFYDCKISFRMIHANFPAL